MAMWMIYAAVVAALVAAGGLALERLCEKADRPRRFVWLGVLTLAVVIPLTANPPERVEGLPTATAGGLDIGSLAGSRPGAPLDGPADTRHGPRGPASPLSSAAPLFVWALGSLFALTVLATVLILSTRARRRWGRRRIGGEDVYVSRRFGPALIGIARPAIVVPRWVLRLGGAVGDRVVAHEREHARAGDHLVLLYAGLILVAFPWNPAIWWMCMRLRAAVEIDCDRRIIASGTPAGEYGSLLLGIGAGRRAGWLFALGMAGSGSLLERRLRTMSGSRRRMGAPTATLLGVLAIGAVTLACDIPAPAGIAPVVGEVLGMRGEAPEPGRQRAERELEAAERQLQAAERELEDAKRVLEMAGQQLQAAERVFEAAASGLKAAGQQLEAAVQAPEEPDPATSVLQRATGPDGRLYIRDRTGTASLVLGAVLAARDPRVQLDGRVLRGGLRSLIPMMDTLDIASIGHYGTPPRVVVRTVGREGGR